MIAAVLVSLAAAVSLQTPSLQGVGVRLRTEAAGLAFQDFHSWTVDLPTEPALLEVHFDASMPGHGHGLATQPTMRELAPGRFQVDGVRFHMAGAWVLRVRFRTARGWDEAAAPFEVSYASDQLRALSLSARGPVRADPTNRWADSAAAAELGRKLFFDPRLSGNGLVSCASCHQPDRGFADNKRFSAPGLTRNTPGLLGVSEAPWLFWDGRRDSLWSQALGPIESKVEMAGSRGAVAELVRSDAGYAAAYRALAGVDAAGVPPDQLFADVGKLLAAFERTLQPRPSRFDRYVDDVAAGRATTALSADERAGLAVFLRPETQCTRCHNGPLFTNQGFHNVGTATLDGDRPDFGRAMGLQALAFDAFHCRSVYSDRRGGCPSLDHARAEGHDGRLTGAFKVPTLRGLALTAPYFHDGSAATIEAVIEHYRRVSSSASEVRAVRISDEEARQLAAFLRALSGER